LEEPFFDSQQVERALGWRAFALRDGETEHVVSENGQKAIIRLRQGGSIYFLKNVPVLSSQEASLLRSAIDEYMERQKNHHLSALESFSAFIKERNISLDKPQHEYLAKVISRIASPAGIISELLEHENLEEIAVIGIGKSKPVYVYDRAFGWVQTNLYFSREREIRNIVNVVASKLGRRLTLKTPSLNAFLEDGSRMNALIEPASVSGPAITIRKFTKSPLTPLELHAYGAVSLRHLAFIWLALQSDCSALVCGNTGSGKTTLLGSLFNFIPQNERIVIVEETPEINIPHRHAVRMATSEGIDAGMSELIVNTLRMRPDRVIVGEVRRRDEAAAYIDTLLAGQGKGSYATFHAQSGQEAIARLQNLGALDSDLAALDLILVQKRWSSFSGGACREERKLVEISEPHWQGGKMRAQKICGFDLRSKKFTEKISRGRAFEKICIAFGLNEKTFGKELSRREKFLQGLHGIKHGEFFDAICGYGQNA